MSVLGAHADHPIDFRPPPADAEVSRAEAATAKWPQQLVDFYALHDGQSDDSNDFTGELLPNSSLFSVARVVSDYQMMMDVNEITKANDPELPFVNAREAGSPAGLFLQSYIPFCGGDGSYYYCDTRPGRHHGCIRHWGRDYCDGSGPVWASIEQMLASIRTCVVDNQPIDRIWMPQFEDGKLTWEPGD